MYKHVQLIWWFRAGRFSPQSRYGTQVNIVSRYKCNACNRKQSVSLSRMSLPALWTINSISFRFSNHPCYSDRSVAACAANVLASLQYRQNGEFFICILTNKQYNYFKHDSGNIRQKMDSIEEICWRLVKDNARCEVIETK